MILIGDVGNKPFSEKVVRYLSTEVIYPEIHIFPDGEQRVRILTKVSEKRVILIKSLSQDVDHNILQFCFLIDALKRNGASFIHAIIPYLGYQRGNHMFREGEAVPLEVIVKCIEAVGVDQITLIDPHSIKILEQFSCPTQILTATALFAKKIRDIESDISLITLIAPDRGGIRSVRELAARLKGANCAIITKERDKHKGEIKLVKVEGTFRKKCFIIDDMISTGSTVIPVVEYLAEHEVVEIYAFATHGVLSSQASTRLEKSAIKKVFLTDTIDIPDNKKFSKLEVLSIADSVARALKKLSS